MPTSLFQLLFKGAAQAKPHASRLRTVGNIVESNNCKGRSGWHRCTVVELLKVPPYDPNVMVRFDGVDEPVRLSRHGMRAMVPLQHAIRALVEEGLLPAELDQHHRLQQMQMHDWLETRGLELRGALSEEQARSPMRQGSQPYVTQAATLCNTAATLRETGCNPE